jgi:signal transduction histidine kinase
VGKDIVALFPDLEQRSLVTPFARALIGESSVLSSALHRYLLPLPPPLREAGVEHMLQTARITPLLSGDDVCGIMIMIEDVTQRESQAEALVRQHRRDEVLSWALAHFLKSDEPRKSVRQLFFKIAEHLDFDTFLLYIRDADTGALSFYTSGGVPEGLEVEFANNPLMLAAAESSETTIFNSVQERSEPEYGLLKKIRISAAVAFPLQLNEQSLGLLCFATWSRKSIQADESELLKTIAQYLAIAVDRENTNQQLQKAREELSNHAQHLERRVEERTLRLKETVTELETFTYTLAHDLKAPVRGMIGYCEVLQEDFANVLPAEVNFIVQKLAQTPKRMDALIKDLLKFSDISRREITLSRVEIEPIVDNVLTMRPPAVRLATNVRVPLHAVRAQGVLLHQVLSNLIDNAAKFVEPATQPKITISTEVVSEASPKMRVHPLLFNTPEPKEAVGTAPPPVSTDQKVRIWVQDEGIGIPAEVHQKIFGIFERGVMAGMYEGTGMGLAIVARATQRMGGACGVESEPGKGSRFWVELPAA